MAFTEVLDSIGVKAIASLQAMFPNNEFFLTVTRTADPAYVFTVIFPLISSLHTLLAADILVVSIVAEWSNTLLKWLLMEDRPFWWVREAVTSSSSVWTKSLPLVRQTPLTCETGPGSPSGHVMGATAVLYVFINWLNDGLFIHNTRLSSEIKKIMMALTWILFIVLVVLVTLSRLYVAAHFPHQCVLGFFFGLGVGWLFTSKRSAVTSWWCDGSRPKLLLASLLMSAVSFSAYWLQKALGIDPQWSVRMAFKWCENPDYIHVSTTPLYSLVRDSGAMFGVALSSPVSRFRKQHNYMLGIVCCFLLTVAFRMATEAIPTGDVRIFYTCQFILFAVEAYLLIATPSLLTRFIKLKKQ